MKSFIRNLSTPAEFCIVVLVCFWWVIIAGVRQLATHLTHTAEPEPITNGLLLRVIVMEILALTFAFWIGHIRGWSLATFGARVSWKGTGAGFLLFIVTLLAVIFCILLTNIIAPGLRNPADTGVKVSGPFTLPFILLMALVNPVYEEVLQAGYFTHALQKFGMFPTVIASALFVTFLHSWKGIDAVLMVLPWRLIVGFYYWRCRQLWPLVFAHMLIDLQGLLAAVAA